MRKALEFEMTAQPAAANFGSNSRAMPASTEENIIFGSSPAGVLSGTLGITVMAAMRAGIGVSSFHRQASPYVLPSLRSLAASHAISNHEWLLSN